MSQAWYQIDNMHNEFTSFFTITEKGKYYYNPHLQMRKAQRGQATHSGSPSFMCLSCLPLKPMHLA